MKEELEKIESIEQVLEILVGKFVALETSVKEALQVEQPNYKPELKHIYSVLDIAKRNYEAIGLRDMINKLEYRMDQVPERTITKHHHHLEFKTKLQLLGGLSVFIVVALAIGLSVSLLVRNHALRADAERFQVVQAYYPSVGKSIVEAYSNNRSRLMLATDSVLNARKISQGQAKQALKKKRRR